MAGVSLIDQIEAHGLAMDQGLITPADAVSSLAECSDGGLTRIGAANVLLNWRTARAEYGRIATETKAALRRLDDDA